MKSMSVALKAHFAQEYLTIATCWKVTLGNGTVKGFTNHDTDLVVSGVTYLAATGFNATDVETSTALNNDNLEVTGILVSPSITVADVNGGLYDYATIKIFDVNYIDLTQGIYSLRDGYVGQITTERDVFVAELQGAMDVYKRSFGKLVFPLCPYNLGDFPFPAPYRGRCKVVLTTFTKTGTLTGVSLDGLTLFDTGRTEAGPTGGIAITGITNANPGVVTTASPLGLPDMSPVTLSGIVGPSSLNTVVVMHNPSGNTFQLAIDTSDTAAYPVYGGSGVATPLGASSGYFDYGLFTATSGLNIGRSMEVKAYIPGQWTLQQPLPYALAIGDTYSMTAGCDKTFATCKGKFSNGNNYGAFPFVPGQDKSIQVAQPQSGQRQGKK